MDGFLPGDGLDEPGVTVIGLWIDSEALYARDECGVYRECCMRGDAQSFGKSFSIFDLRVAAVACDGVCGWMVCFDSFVYGFGGW